MKLIEIEKEETGLMCDNPNCDWRDETIKDCDYPNWLNQRCPKCDEIVLTQEDNDRYFEFKQFLNLIKDIEIPDNDLPTQKYEITTSFHKALNIEINESK